VNELIEIIAKKIYNYMFLRTEIDPELEDAYRYGIEITISSALNILLVMAISCVLGNPLSGFCFLTCIILLRSFCGGYHANSYVKCNSTMVILFIISYFVWELFTYYKLTDFGLMSALLMLGFLPIYAFAPVENKRKPLSRRKIRKCRVLSISMYILLSLLGLFFISYGVLYGSIIIIALLEVSVLILVEICIQRRCNNEISENDSRGH